jgi:hypothetical protein
VDAALVIALGLSLLWMMAVSAYFLVIPATPQDADSLRMILTVVAVIMPLVMIWVAVIALRASKTMREESARLQSALEAMRQTQLKSQSLSQAIKPSVERKLDELAAAQRKTETALASFSAIRSLPDAPPDVTSAVIPEEAEEALEVAEAQGSLELGTLPEPASEKLQISDLIKAVNFPQTAEDQDGFRALRRALDDRTLAALIRSSQDVLTMLSEDGVYMDDLHPDLARPDAWRRFARGERGRAVSELGGVRDRTCLTLTAARMREDAIFRDAVHHFLRRFDKVFVAFEEDASDQQIVAFSDTRTARAFMLLGRVAGIFS